jgi:hypothetical protein
MTSWLGLEVSSALQALAKLERVERKMASGQILAEQMDCNAEVVGVDELPGAYAAEAWTIGEIQDCNVELLCKLLRKVEQPELAPEGTKELAVEDDCAKTAVNNRDRAVATERLLSIVICSTMQEDQKSVRVV